MEFVVHGGGKGGDIRAFLFPRADILLHIPVLFPRV